MTFPEMFVLWTARIAVVCMLVRVVLAGRNRQSGPTRQECMIWTFGFLVFLMHVAAAFQFQHGWSHAAAYRHTAEQTAAVTGWHWGGGLYVNYAFTVLWGLDVVCDWQAQLSGRRRHGCLPAGTRGFLAFVVVNATVVFGHPGWWLVAATLGIALIASRSRKPTPESRIENDP